MSKPETKTGCYHCTVCRFYHGVRKGCSEPRCQWVSEAEHTKSMEEYGKQNEALATVCYDQQVDITKLRESLEAIKTVFEKRPKIAKHEVPKKKDGSYDWASLSIIQEKKLLEFQAYLDGLGVLLSPKELDQKTVPSHSPPQTEDNKSQRGKSSGGS